MDDPVHGLGGDGRTGGHRRPLLRVQGLSLKVLQPGGAILRGVHAKGALLLGRDLEGAGHLTADAGADLPQNSGTALGSVSELLTLLFQGSDLLLQGIQVSALLLQLGGDGRQSGLDLGEAVRRGGKELQTDSRQLAGVAASVGGLHCEADLFGFVFLSHGSASSKIRIIFFLRAAAWAASRSCRSASITPSSQERADISVAGFAGMDTADTS